MKKIKILLLVISLILISGCSKVEYEMEIKKDKSMNLSIIEAVDRNYVNDISEVIDSGQIRELEDNGFYIQKYNEDNMIGYQLTKTIDNIDSVSTDEKLDSTDALNAILKKDKPLFTIKKGFLKNKYIASFDATSFIKDKEGEISSNISDSNIEFRLKLPYEPISNNATNILNNGTVYVWDITKLSNIDFEFELYNLTNLYIVVGIIVFIIISLIISIFKSFSKKNKVDFKPIYNTKYKNEVNNDNAPKQQFINENIINGNNNIENNTFIQKEETSSVDTKLFTWEQNDNNNDNNVNKLSNVSNSIIEPNFIPVNNNDKKD